MKIKLINIIHVTFLSLSAYYSVSGKSGPDELPSGYLVILGTYQNQPSGNITLDGTITITGNWTNNAPNTEWQRQMASEQWYLMEAACRRSGVPAHTFQF